MNQWEVQVALDVLGDTITWSLSDRGLESLRESIRFGEMGRARILRVKALVSELPETIAA